MDKVSLLAAYKSAQEDQEVKQLLSSISQKGGLFASNAHPVYSLHYGDRKFIGTVHALSNEPESLTLLPVAVADTKRVLQILPQDGSTMQGSVLLTQTAGEKMALTMLIGVTLQQLRALLSQLDEQLGLLLSEGQTEK